VRERRRVRVNIKENELLRLIAVADIAAEALLAGAPKDAMGEVLPALDNSRDAAALVCELATQAQREYAKRGESVPPHVAEALAGTRKQSSIEFHDKVLKCVDCGGEFIFTAGEQLFFRDKQFKNEPKRCKSCKSKRLAVLGNPTAQGRSLDYPKVAVRTACSQCGKEVTVPFGPTQGRPVFCRECFNQKGNAASLLA
jgi:CxxC-x17-CxxC domain-containing protein